MLLSEFDYELPEELIAQHPLDRRDASRMLVVDRASGSWTDLQFSDFPDYIGEHDVVVVNNTRVFPARLIGRRELTGGRVEVLLIREIEPNEWEALVRPGNRLKEGARIVFGNGELKATVVDGASEGVRRVRLQGQHSIASLVDALGQTPLPPYIKRPQGTSAEDDRRYQTVFARNRGAIAAPTAGLHFTPEMLDRVRAKGAAVAEITLHVGYGTFEPVRVTHVRQHRVGGEVFEITSEAAQSINGARLNGGRVIAVGTTTVRALESAVNPAGDIKEVSGQETTLTITPGFEFRVVDRLLTNFHLPQSSLLLLVSAFAGRELTLRAYRHAVAALYRFYSYGDCMLIV